MRYASACDGIGAVHVAWEPLGWSCAWTAEIEPFPAAVVEHHYGFPNLGDIERITDGQLEQHGPIDLLVGGTPCQSFSVAGLRAGMADPRGNLALAFLGLAARARPEWVVWENVPGVLSSNDGRDFGTFLGALGELGYGFAYRVLDAQFFGVPQRRRRVFVVGHLGDWRRAAAVLFERESLSGNPAPGRETGEGVAFSLAARTSAGGGLGTDFDCDGGLIAGSLTKRYGKGINTTVDDGAIVTAFNWQNGGGYGEANDGLGITEDGTGQRSRSQVQAVAATNTVRRLTPRECERLQGFPDDYTLIQYRNKPAADGPRYKALGNSMAVPVMRWIGERI